MSCRTTGVLAGVAFGTLIENIDAAQGPTPVTVVRERGSGVVLGAAEDSAARQISSVMASEAEAACPPQG